MKTHFLKLGILKASRSVRVLALVAALSASVQLAPAVIRVQRDYPMQGGAGEAVSDQDRLASLVALYRNDVVLLANPEEAFAKEIRETRGNPATMEKLRSLSTTNGEKLSAGALATSVAAVVRQNPQNAPSVVASGLELLSNDYKGLTLDERFTVASGGIKGIPYEVSNRPQLIAAIIGVSVRGMKQADATKLVRQLREFAIYDTPFSNVDSKGGYASVPSAAPEGDTVDGEKAGFALALDQALVEAGILSPFPADPAFVAMASNFATDQLAETFFSGDQGVINQGALFSPGGAGSSGGSGNTGNQPPPPEPPAS
jgi:hypothetical protein